MLSALENSIHAFAEQTQGTVGVVAKHLESGTTVQYRERESFFMASTFKVPIAIEVLRQIEAGPLSLRKMIKLKDADQREGAYIVSRFDQDMEGVQLSIQNLIQYNLEYSDNAATDILLREIGGTSPVQKMLETIGIKDMQVNYWGLGDLCLLYGIALEPEKIKDFQHFQQLKATVSEEKRNAARTAFMNSTEINPTTPLAMSQLWEDFFLARLTTESHRDLLLKFMRNCKTFTSRLPGLLPAGTPVARKTGTIDHFAADVGIITLPQHKGHIVISVYIKNAKTNADQLNRTIAEISRSIYDYFLYF